MQEKTNDLKKELSFKEEVELKDLENSQPIHSIKKKKKAYLRENTKGVAKRMTLRRLVSHVNRSQGLLFKTVEESKGAAASSVGTLAQPLSLPHSQGSALHTICYNSWPPQMCLGGTKGSLCHWIDEANKTCLCFHIVTT